MFSLQVEGERRRMNTKERLKWGYLESIEILFNPAEMIPGQWLTVLLMIDGEWRTIAEIMRNSSSTFGIDKTRVFFKWLSDNNYIERRKINNKTIQFKRKHNPKKHQIGGI